MVIFSDRTGQLGNQLFEFGTFIGNSSQYGSKLVNIMFKDYEQYFEGPQKPNGFENIRTSFGSKTLDKIAHRLLVSSKFLAFLNTLGFMLQGDDTPRDISTFNTNKKLRIKKGSWFTDFENFYKFQDQIRTYFTPIPVHMQRINGLIAESRKDCDVLVGLHIRRGDYKNFLDGKYYFENDMYYDKALQLARQFPDKKVKFIICSNDQINPEEFKELSVQLGLNHFIEDMYTLSQCDYILGPPSTYTMWASFYGQKPLLKLRDKQQEILINDFKIDYGY